MPTVVAPDRFVTHEVLAGQGVEEELAPGSVCGPATPGGSLLMNFDDQKR
jgi:hypothetical protein